jgi:hypothetical protein
LPARSSSNPTTKQPHGKCAGVWAIRRSSGIETRTHTARSRPGGQSCPRRSCCSSRRSAGIAGSGSRRPWHGRGIPSTATSAGRSSGRRRASAPGRSPNSLASTSSPFSAGCTTTSGSGSRAWRWARARGVLRASTRKAKAFWAPPWPETRWTWDIGSRAGPPSRSRSTSTSRPTCACTRRPCAGRSGGWTTATSGRNSPFVTSRTAGRFSGHGGRATPP